MPNQLNHSFKFSAMALLSMALTGCLTSGGTKANVTTPTPVATIPTPAAVLAAANASNSLNAGTSTTATTTVINGNGAGATTTGVAGMSVSLPSTRNNTANTSTLGAIAIDPTFSATLTGGDLANSATAITALSIQTTNATSTGSSLSISSSAALGLGDTKSQSASTSNVTFSQNISGVDSTISVKQDLGYSYTQYGNWNYCDANCASSTGTSHVVTGHFVRGDATSPTNIPTTGTATYAGDATGTLVSGPSNSSTTTLGTVSAAIDFSARTVGLNITNPAGSLREVHGTLTYAASQNLFTGTVNNGTGLPAAAAMTGTASGRFYGPAAQEIGGTYALSGGATGPAAVHYGSFVAH